jgi:hypothetical protein
MSSSAAMADLLCCFCLLILLTALRASYWEHSLRSLSLSAAGEWQRYRKDARSPSGEISSNSSPSLSSNDSSTQKRPPRRRSGELPLLLLARAVAGGGVTGSPPVSPHSYWLRWSCTSRRWLPQRQQISFFRHVLSCILSAVLMVPYIS